MRRESVLTLLSLTLFSLVAHADQVTLKNGDRLSGAIVKTDDDTRSLLMKTEFAGDVTIEWESVTAIESSQPLHLTLSDGRVIVGTVRTADGKFEVATKDAGTIAAEHGAIKAVRSDAEQTEVDRLLHPRLRDYWSGLFDLGLSITGGNSSATALTIAGKASRVVPKKQTDVVLHASLRQGQCGVAFRYYCQCDSRWGS
jgi:hypothetical protein